IPSKAMLESSERFYATTHALPRQGINVGNVSLDLKKLLMRKDDVVKKNTDGVAYLFKKNKIDHIKGQGKITAPGTVEVQGQSYKTKNILIATGSAPIQLPALAFDG